jgi:hypothetical protein
LTDRLGVRKTSIESDVAVRLGSWRHRGLFAALALVALVLLWVIAGAVLSTDRGLDVTDEGLYLLAADPPSRTAGWFMPFGWSTAPLFGVVAYDIAAFRTAGAVLLMLAGGWLGWTLVCLVAPRDFSLGLRARGELVIEGLAVGTGMMVTLLFYGNFLRTPGYNWVNFLGILVAAGGVTTLISLRRGGLPSRPNSVLLWLAAAAAALGLFFTIPAKPSTAPLLLVLALCLLIAWLGPRRGATAMIMILIMLLGWLLVALATTWWPLEFLSVFTRGVNMPAPAESHTLAGALRDLLSVPNSFAIALWNSSYEYLGLLIIGLVVQAIPVATGKRMQLIRIIGFALSVLAGWLLADLVGLLILLIAVILFLARLPESSPIRDTTGLSVPWRLGTLLVFIVMLPFVFGFGSTAGSFDAAVAAAGVLVIAAVTAAGGIGTSRMRLMAMGTISLFALLSVVSTLAFARQHPYRQPPIDTQTVALEIGSKGSSLRVDPKLHILLQSLRRQAKQVGWVEGSPLVGVEWRWSSTIPYVLGATPPESLMLTLFGYDSALPVAEYNLGPGFEGFAWKDAWLLSTAADSLDDASLSDIEAVTDALEARSGRAFPSGYLCVARAGSSLLWKPVDARGLTVGAMSEEDLCPPAMPETSPYDFSGGWAP